MYRLLCSDKSKVVCAHAMQEYKGSKGVAPLINFGAR